MFRGSWNPVNRLGGDLFVIYGEKKTGRLYGLNSSDAAPKELTPQFISKQRMPMAGILSVTVPGAYLNGDR